MVHVHLCTKATNIDHAYGILWVPKLAREFTGMELETVPEVPSANDVFS